MDTEIDLARVPCRAKCSEMYIYINDTRNMRIRLAVSMVLTVRGAFTLDIEVI